MMFLSACTSSLSEGKATAILDAARQPAQAHRAALVGGDVAQMRHTGAALLQVLSCAYDNRPGAAC
jgi:hypothetical protein